MVCRSWRSQTERTPKGEIVSPCLASSLEIRVWPHADRHRRHRRLDLRPHPVLQDRLATRHLLKRQFPAFVVEILEPVEAIPAVAHDLAGLADVAELLGQFEQAGLRPNDFLVIVGVS